MWQRGLSVALPGLQPQAFENRAVFYSPSPSRGGGLSRDDEGRPSLGNSCYLKQTPHFSQEYAPCFHQGRYSSQKLLHSRFLRSAVVPTACHCHWRQAGARQRDCGAGQQFTGQTWCAKSTLFPWLEKQKAKEGH